MHGNCLRWQRHTHDIATFVQKSELYVDFYLSSCHRKVMHQQKKHILLITTFWKWQKNSICGARTVSYTFLRQKNGNLGKIQNRTFFGRENLGYLNIRSDILILREKLFHILESAQPRFINAFRRSKRNVTVHPPTPPRFFGSILRAYYFLRFRSRL